MENLIISTSSKGFSKHSLCKISKPQLERGQLGFSFDPTLMILWWLFLQWTSRLLNLFYQELCWWWFTPSAAFNIFYHEADCAWSLSKKLLLTGRYPQGNWLRWPSLHRLRWNKVWTDLTCPQWPCGGFLQRTNRNHVKQAIDGDMSRLFQKKKKLSSKVYFYYLTLNSLVFKANHCLLQICSYIVQVPYPICRVIWMQ